MGTYKKIIFVCEDNTFTSLVAEYIAKNKMMDMGIETESRGMVVLLPEPPNPKGVAIAKSRGIDIEGYITKSVDDSMFGTQTLVLAMTEKIKNELYSNFNSAVNVYTLKGFVGMSGNIQTPYGKTMKEYGEVYTHIENLVGILAEKLSR